MFSFFYLSINTIMSVIQNVKLQYVLTADVYGKEAIFGLLRRRKRKKKYFFSREEKRILKSYNRGRKG